MARSRNIKPSIMDNEDLAALEPLTRLLFIYLWMLADREGRLEDRPGRIAHQALGYDRTADVGAMLDALQRAGFILRYTAGDKACIQILQFAKHQAPHVREAASELPTPDTTKAVPEHCQGSASTSPRSPDSGFLIPDSSVPNGTGGKPPEPTPIPTPSPTPKPDPDPVKHEIWTTGRAVLRVTGQGDKELGKFLGKLINDYTPGIVLDAVRATAAALPDDPKEYLTACCRRASGKRKTPAKEPEWRTEQRQRTQQAAPGVAVSAAPADQFFIDVEARNVPAIE